MIKKIVNFLLKGYSMEPIDIKAHPDLLEKISKETPVKALAELIWNGFDAKAKNVHVKIYNNDLGSIDSIEVMDTGDGIVFEKLDDLFGDLGGSWKKSAKKSGEDYLHGENGQGRFKSFSLGGLVEWDTNYIDGDDSYNYKIKSDVNELLRAHKTEKTKNKVKKKGTTVTISNVTKEASILNTEIKVKLAEIFCMYLSKYKDKKLFFKDEEITPDLVQKSVKKINMGDVYVSEDLTIELVINIVEWKESIKSCKQVNYCNKNGFTLYEEKITKKLPAVISNFTVFAESDYFDECKDNGTLQEIDLSDELTAIRRIITDKTLDYFLELKSIERSKVVSSWVDENIYPYENVNTFNPVLEAEKKVFDILAVNVQTYLKKFEKSDNKTKKFTFKLLKQALESNPESVQKIVNDVLELSQEEQDDLANLLEKTTFSSIISASKSVTDRLDFIHGLRQLVFDKESKKALLERDQLHKILEKEAWIFREDFYLTGSEETLNEVLKKHMQKLGKRSDDENEPVTRPDGSTGRIDLMLSKTRQPSEGKIEHLVVEIKRPSQKINAEIISQIKSYAFAVSSDERFDKTNTRWTFIAVSNEMDSFALEEIDQTNRARGLIYEKDNLSVWIYTWSEIIQAAQARLHFFQKQLGYEASRTTATDYLEEKYRKFIPENINYRESETI